MTDEQRHCIYHMLHEIRPSEVHHGDCIGADADFHWIVRKSTDINAMVVGHPPTKVDHRAYTECDMLFDPDDYLKRNHKIVDSTDVLLACPSNTREEHHSGTWATIRYARKTFKPIKIIWPDGSVTEED